MISSKSDLKEYILRDCVAHGRTKIQTKPVVDNVWHAQVLMRKAEYYNNCWRHRGIIGKLFSKVANIRWLTAAHRCGFSVALNVFGPGLSFGHQGTIIVNANSRIGENCRIMDGVTIGTNRNSNKAPKIGNNVYISTGAKIIGDISVADNVVIGANAVVVKDILEPHTTWGGYRLTN